MLHRAMSNLSVPSVVEGIDPDIPVPQGYLCETHQELLAAYDLLGQGTVILKPCRSGAGGWACFATEVGIQSTKRACKRPLALGFRVL
jgi:hypothetical protein